MLKVKNLEVYYHHIHALCGISFKVDEGEIVSLLGANGAGKTTTLASISGLVKPFSGSIYFEENEITKLLPHQIVHLGITHSPEGRGIFEPLSVMENLELGGYIEKNKRSIKERIKDVFEIFPILSDRKNQIAGTLSGGEQQMLAIARALISKPKLLLLDEPSLGLSPVFVKVLFETIKRINEKGITILLVEQNANFSLNISHYGYILDTGKIVLEGKSSFLKDNELVKRAYLGEA